MSRTRSRPFGLRRRARRGQALVESALSYGILLLLVLGGIDAMQMIGIHYDSEQVLRTTAHQAAILGSTGGLDGDTVYALSASDGGAPLATGPVAEAARSALGGTVFARPEFTRIQVRCDSNPCRRYSRITVRVVASTAVFAPIPMLFERIDVDRSLARSSEKDQQ